MADELNRYPNSYGYSPTVFSRQIMHHSLPSDPPPFCGDHWKLRNSTPSMHGQHKHVSLTGSKPPWQKQNVVFGSPSYPSPLDRIRTGKRDRAAQMGLALAQEASFEVNQSFPKAAKTKLCLDEIVNGPQMKLETIKGDGLNDVSFTSGHSKGSFSMSSDQNANQSMNDSGWSFYNYVGGGTTGLVFPASIRNPNKAICTVSAKTSEILIANEMACELFGYDQSDLIGMSLKELVRLKRKDQIVIEESYLQRTGEIVEMSGKVVDAVDSCGIILPVSLWVKKLECNKEKRCLVVMEPVDRTVATFTFNGKGTILSCDNQLADLHGYLTSEDVAGLKIKQLIPAFKIPVTGKKIPKLNPELCPFSYLETNLKKQSITGRTKDGNVFPLSVSVKLLKECEDDTAPYVYQGTVWVFSNISGLITFLPDGTIHSINDNLARLLFGYTKNEVVGQDISFLIPDFYDILDIEEEIVPFPQSDTGEPQLDVKLDGSEGSRIRDGSDDQGIGSSITSSQNQGTKLDIQLDGLVTPPEILSTSTPNKVSKGDGPVLNGSLNKFLSRTQISSTSTTGNCSPIAVVNNTDKFVDSQQSSDIPTPSFSEELSPALVSTDARSVSPNTSASPQCLDDERRPARDKRTMHISCEKLTENSASFEKDNSISDSMLNYSVLEEDDVEESFEDKSILSSDEKLELNTTAELLAARLDAVCLHMSCSDSAATDALESLYQEKNANISDILNSFERTGEETNNLHCDKDPSPQSLHYIPKCQPPVQCENSSNEDKMEPLPTSSKSLKRKKSTSALLSNSSLNCPDSASRTQYLKSLYGEISNEDLDSRQSLHNQSQHIAYDSGSDKENSFPSFENSSNGNSVSGSHYSADYHSVADVRIPEGSFTGQCTHRDKSIFGIMFQIKRVQQADGSFVYCMWVSRDPEEAGEGGRSYANLTLASTLNSSCNDISDTSLGTALVSKAQSESKIREPEQPEIKPVEPWCDSPSRGPYSEKYETLQSIGKGAFGFVKLAHRKRDKKEVVVKFIRRAKVLTSSWRNDPHYRMIPLEVSLLTKLSHVNIVTVLDVFQNDEYVQMVMQKHGGGMDLFEFIDRSPRLDEPLTSYLFRQMVSAISYLHSMNILHRDVKDENIILNEEFHIKLIDFGAATFMDSGQLFSTFCGTLEYCSPEVLLGNKYRGPELESWSLGVTLYTLVFGENPFFDVDETIRCVLKPPFQVSRSLMFLLLWILHPDPEKRATIGDVENNNWVHQPVHISDYEWSDVLPNSDFYGNIASDYRRTTPEGDGDTSSLRVNKTELQRQLVFAEMNRQFDDSIS